MPKPYIIMPESHWVDALDAVREKTGTTGTILSEELAAEIGRISGSGIDTSDATATAADIASPKTAYVNGEKVTGTLLDYRGIETGLASLDGWNYNSSDNTIDFQPDDEPSIYDSNTTFKIDQEMFIADIGLTADKIAEGETILGVTGTHSGGGGGDTTMEDGMVTRTATTYTNDRVTSIGASAFTYYSTLTTVSFPNVTTIGNFAFERCYSLTSVSFPKATSIGASAFAYCSSLTTVSFPNVTVISAYAFMNCRSLTSVSFPKATTISGYAFAYCRSLTTVSFPNVTVISADAFTSCSSLTSVSFPNVTTIGSYAFVACYGLTSVSFPNVTAISSSAFRNCSNLTSVSFPKVTTIGNSAFSSCTALSKIYLGASTLCSLGNSNAFSNTRIWSNKGSIFVPTSLVASYKAATNWVFFSNRIFGF